MNLPSLKISLPFIFLCWCVAAVYTHGTVMLAYPAMWAVVGLLFFGLHVVIRSSAKPQAVTPTPPGTAERIEAAVETGDTAAKKKVSASA